MAQLFDEVFNKATIYDMLFFNVKSVLEQPNLKELEENNNSSFIRWNNIARSKYKLVGDDDGEANRVYKRYGIYYPEFCKIVAITYGTVVMESGKLQRHMKRIVNDNEFIVLSSFMDVLYRLSSEGVQATPQHFPTLCGHNIVSNDIPLLIKRFLAHRTEFENRELPLMLKRSLSIKPWESGVIDTYDVWKLNGYEKTVDLMLVSDFLGLKKSVDLLPPDELSELYWSGLKLDAEETYKMVSLQSATQINLVIQLMNTLRYI